MRGILMRLLHGGEFFPAGGTARTGRTREVPARAFYTRTMALSANILVKEGIEGPQVLELLEDVARDEKEIALLHSADGSGLSVLALRPVVTLNIDHAGRAEWIARAGLEQELSTARAAPLEVFGRAVASV